MSTQSPEPRSGIAGKSVLVLAAALLSALVSYVFNPFFIAPRVGPEGIAVVGAFLYLFYALSFPQRPISLTITKYISHFNAQDEPGIVATVLVNSLRKLFLFGVPLSMLLAVCAAPIASYLNLESIWPVVAAIALGLVGLFFTAVLAVLQGLLRFQDYALCWVIDPTFRLIGGIVLIVMGWGVAGALLGYVIGYLVAIALALWLLRDLVFRKNKKAFNHLEMYAYSVPVCVFSAYVAFVMSADVLIAKHYFSDRDAGIFVAASTLAKIMFVVIMPLNGVAFAMMSDAVARGQEIKSLFFKTLGFALVGGLLVIGSYHLLSDAVIRYTYGLQFMEAAALLSLATLSFLPPAMTMVYAHYCLARQNSAFLYGVALGCFAHVGLFLLYHDSLRDLVLANLTGGLLEFALAVGIGSLAQFVATIAKR